MSDSGGADIDQFDYFAWRKQAESFPCAPAKGLPKLGTADKVLLRSVAASLTPAAAAAQLEQLVAEAIGAGAHVLVVRVASWSDEESVAQSLLALRDQHGWALKRHQRPLINPPPYVTVGLHRVVGRHTEDNGVIESVPMVLGPFLHFPPSRYCPVPIFEMSVCTENPRKLVGKYRINFLGIPTPKLSDAQRADLIEKAKQATELVNNGEDTRAKPRVSATFSASLERLFN